MRKDSEIFLKKCLQYKTEIGEDAFELNITYFGGIPNIEVEIDEINCVWKSERKSECC